MKRWFFVFLVVGLFVLSGCAEKEVVEESLCNKPYFEYMKGQCCLDSNDNQICDKDETKEEELVEEEEEVIVGSQEEFIKGIMNNVVKIETNYGVDLGSGFFIDEEGYVLTNYHVIYGYEDGERNVTVKSYDSGHSSDYLARVLGYDYAHDLAVLKIDSKREWKTFPFAETVRLGDTVYALGSPFDYEFSASKGIISGKNRPGLNDKDLEEYFQTDAAVNFGNSGGPLVNEKGEVVGLNTFGVAPWWSEGLNFALDSKKAKEIYQNIRYVADLFGNLEWGAVINKNFNEKMNIFLKEIKVRWDGLIEEGYLVSFDYIAQNKDSVEHNICFEIKIMKGGVIVSNQMLDEKIKLTAGMQKLGAEQIIVNSKFEGECSNYHFEITSMDCESKEVYSRNIMKNEYYKRIEE